MGYRRTSPTPAHRAAATPLTVYVTLQRDLRRDGSKRPYNQKASTIHGWVTKLRGTLSGNERTRTRGIREMRAAKATRQYRRKRAAERKARGRSSGSGLFAFLGLGKKKKSSRHGSQRAVITRGSSSRSTKKGGESTLHFSHRTRPSHHGQGTKIAGHITQSRAMVVRGQSMNKSAAKEREQARARRQQQSKRDARDMKADAARSRRR